MAKLFYTLAEAEEKLGMNENEIKQLTREGRLREFRDGPRLMFRTAQVEMLVNPDSERDLGTLPSPPQPPVRCWPRQEKPIRGDVDKQSKKGDCASKPSLVWRIFKAIVLLAIGFGAGFATCFLLSN